MPWSLGLSPGWSSKKQLDSFLGKLTLLFFFSLFVSPDCKLDNESKVIVFRSQDHFQSLALKEKRTTWASLNK